tara:strand:- start:6888 stop:7340 length:453 start_codon:yes stop_codon:yes gene_type:complete
MRLINPLVARPEWYDRAPSIAAVQTSGNRSENTGWTTGASYTVPTDKKAWLGTVKINQLVYIAFTTVTPTDFIDSIIDVTPSGGAAKNLSGFSLASAAVTAGDMQKVSSVGGMALFEGDLIELKYQVVGDAAGAGRVQIAETLHYVEFEE